MNDINVSDDEDVNWLFGKVAEELHDEFEMPMKEAVNLAFEYYSRFTSEAFCSSIGIPTQDHEFFHHESAGGLALRSYYYLVLMLDPDPASFIDWRTKRHEGLRQSSDAARKPCK